MTSKEAVRGRGKSKVAAESSPAPSSNAFACESELSLGLRMRACAIFDVLRRPFVVGSRRPSRWLGVDLSRVVVWPFSCMDCYLGSVWCLNRHILYLRTALTRFQPVIVAYLRAKRRRKFVLNIQMVVPTAGRRKIALEESFFERTGLYWTFG